MQISTGSTAGKTPKRGPGQPSCWFLLPLNIVVIGTVAIVGIIGIAGCGGAGGNGGTPAATPTPTIAPTATPTPTPAPTATPTVITVAVAPASVTLSVGNTRSFTASVSGAANVSQAVTWSVEEGSGGGTIGADGLYTAPANPGTYHILATCQADTSRFAVATVIVQAGSAVGSIQ